MRIQPRQSCSSYSVHMSIRLGFWLLYGPEWVRQNFHGHLPDELCACTWEMPSIRERVLTPSIVGPERTIHRLYFGLSCPGCLIILETLAQDWPTLLLNAEAR